MAGPWEVTAHAQGPGTRAAPEGRLHLLLALRQARGGESGEKAGPQLPLLGLRWIQKALESGPLGALPEAEPSCQALRDKKELGGWRGGVGGGDGTKHPADPVWEASGCLLLGRGLRTLAQLHGLLGPSVCGGRGCRAGALGTGSTCREKGGQAGARSRGPAVLRRGPRSLGLCPSERCWSMQSS